MPTLPTGYSEFSKTLIPNNTKRNAVPDYSKQTTLCYQKASGTYQYTAPSDGFFQVGCRLYNWGQYTVYINDVVVVPFTSVSYASNAWPLFPVRKGAVIKVVVAKDADATVYFMPPK